MEYKALCLIPVAVVLIAALLSKRTFEPMLAGAIIGFIIMDPSPKFFIDFVDAFYTVMADTTTIWVILVCGLFGSLIALIEKSGGTEGFTRLATKVVRGRKSALLMTWILGIIVFIDEYLNALAVGFAMRKVTDKYHIPREELAYVANSTGATVCVLIPFTTWSAFMISQIVEVLKCDPAQGTATYLQIIPWIFYGWIAVLAVPLFIFKVIPAFGPIRRARERAENGQCLPASTAKEAKAANKEEMQRLTGKRARAVNFVVPMVILAAITVLTNEILYGVIAGVITCIVMYVPQKLMSTTEICDTLVKGFEDMFPVLVIIVTAFVLQIVNEGLGLPTYVINAVEPILSPSLLPMFSFGIVAALAFCTGSFWGVAAIAFPIICPLASSMGVNVLLVAGAVVSGASFGSQSCFYSDAVTLTCAATQIKNNDYARCVLPILSVPFMLGIVAFFVAGLVFV